VLVLNQLVFGTQNMENPQQDITILIVLLWLISCSCRACVCLLYFLKTVCACACVHVCGVCMYTYTFSPPMWAKSFLVWKATSINTLYFYLNEAASTSWNAETTSSSDPLHILPCLVDGSNNETIPQRYYLFTIKMYNLSRMFF